MKTLVFFTFVFAFHNMVQAQKESTANAVAHFTESGEASLTQKFEFIKSISINCITGNKKSPSNLNYTLRYPDTDSYMAMSISGFSDAEAESVPEIVLDFAHKIRFTFMSFGEIKMARTHILDDSQNDISILKLNLGNLKETGRAEDILGYNAVEYKLNDGDYKGSVWLTALLDKSLEKPFIDLGLKYKSVDSGSPAGYIMRVDAGNIITQEVFQLSVSGININDAYSIDSSAYLTTAPREH